MALTWIGVLAPPVPLVLALAVAAYYLLLNVPYSRGECDQGKVRTVLFQMPSHSLIAYDVAR